MNYRAQRGVALIQVLLLSALIGLLAIQFSYTARDQIEAATAMDQRVRAQLAAESALHIGLFAELSYHVNPLNGYPPGWGRYQSLGHAGQWRDIGEGVRISQRDITAKLPLRYPDHPLWPKLLESYGYDSQQQQAILGVMQDFQDPDDNAWHVGREVGVTDTGMPYLNRPIQLPDTLPKAMASWPGLPDILSRHSHHYANYAVNMAAADEALLAALTDPAIARELVAMREAGQDITRRLQPLLNNRFPEDAVTTSTSTRRRFAIQVQQGDVQWQQVVDVSVSALGKPPWQIIFRPSAP